MSRWPRSSRTRSDTRVPSSSAKAATPTSCAPRLPSPCPPAGNRASIGVPANPQADPAAAVRLAEAGLIRLYVKLVAHIHKQRQLHPDLEIRLNATGGFKAETAILYGLGCALGIRVYYLHETYRVPITLPFCALPF